VRSSHVGSAGAPQIDIVNAELYHYDGDCIAKAADMGYPGLVDIRQRQVINPDLDCPPSHEFPRLAVIPALAPIGRPENAVRHHDLCRCRSDEVMMVLVMSARQDTFIFRVEGTGVLRPDEVVSMALEWMQQKMLMLNAALQSNAGEDAMLE